MQCAYAASIMAVIEDIARAKESCVGLSLWVRSTNEAAIGPYRKVGFTEDPDLNVQGRGG